MKFEALNGKGQWILFNDQVSPTKLTQGCGHKGLKIGICYEVRIQ